MMNDEIREACSKAHVTLPDGSHMPKLGQGTWEMGDSPKSEGAEVEAVQTGIELGMTLIDTAEMYGEGASETLIGKAITSFARQDYFMVSKVYPHNANKKNIFDSCQRSVERLGCGYLDMYLLHWRGAASLPEVVECMERMVGGGWIKRWGVSNFDVADMEELWKVPGGNRCAINQVLYHLGSRGIEFDLIPWHKEHNIPVMAYSPIAQAGSMRMGMLAEPALIRVAQKHGVQPIQILLAFALREPNVVAIPKSAKKQHVQMNAESILIHLDEEDMESLGKVFPAPQYKMHLDFI